MALNDYRWGRSRPEVLSCEEKLQLDVEATHSCIHIRTVKNGQRAKFTDGLCQLLTRVTCKQLTKTLGSKRPAVD